MKNENSKVCAVVVNDYGQILPYTCKSTMQDCEEHAESFFPNWAEMKEFGCKVVQAQIDIYVPLSAEAERILSEGIQHVKDGKVESIDWSEFPNPEANQHQHDLIDIAIEAVKWHDTCEGDCSCSEIIVELKLRMTDESKKQFEIKRKIPNE